MYKIALDEIRSGKKRSHWIWFIFPQIKGLGHSHNSQYYGIQPFDEAKAFLEYSLLGTNLREITKTLLTHRNKPISSILSPIDAVKLQSSMTLFDFVSPNNIFSEVLQVFCDRHYRISKENKIKAINIITHNICLKMTSQ